MCACTITLREYILHTCLFATEVVTPLLLTLGRSAEEGANTKKHLYEGRIHVSMISNSKHPVWLGNVYLTSRHLR